MKIKLLSLILFFCYLTITNGATQQPYIGKQDGMKQANKIVALPGQPSNVKLEQYSGYVTINPNTSKSLFYYFVESPKDAAKKPLVLWLNGGPGCSSVGLGAFAELGPFYINSDRKTLRSNEYAWNNVANMLFLESPVGVGFSYSNSKEDNKLALGDTGATEDAYVFLLNWLERFPEYKNRDFYIIGQSFAGRYIPLLANYIVSKNANSSIKINLKGVAMGNPKFDDDTNEKARYEFLYTHDVISEEGYGYIQQSCSFETAKITDLCQAALEKALPSIDIYNVYAPSCQNKINGALSYGEMTKIDPCLEDYTKAYFDLPEVQTALHANITRTREFEWDKCRKGISMETWNYSSPTMVPVVKELLSSGLRTWIYNGDMDSVCPVAATKIFLNKTGVEQIDERREFFSDLEIAGFVTSYANVTVVVVRGSGHMVPKDQPQTALLLFSSFLRDKLPPLYPIYPSDAPPAYDPDNSQDLGPSPNDPYEDDSQYSPPAPNAPADDDSEILSPSPSPNDSVGSQIPAPPKLFF